jgi:hypothetical protein
VDTTTVVDDPILGSAREALRLTVSNTSSDPVSPGSPEHHAQAESPTIIGLEADVYAGLSILIPKDIPGCTTPRTSATAASRSRQRCFPSTAGPFGLEPAADRHHRLRARSGAAPAAQLHYGYDSPWQLQTERGTPADVTGRWIDFVIHTKMSTSSSVGFREQWVDTGAGFVKQMFADGTTRLMMQTVDGSNGGGRTTPSSSSTSTTTRSSRPRTPTAPLPSSSPTTGSGRPSTRSPPARTDERHKPPNTVRRLPIRKLVSTARIR